MTTKETGLKGEPNNVMKRAMPRVSMITPRIQAHSIPRKKPRPATKAIIPIHNTRGGVIPRGKKMMRPNGNEIREKNMQVPPLNILRTARIVTPSGLSPLAFMHACITAVGVGVTGVSMLRSLPQLEQYFSPFSTFVPHRGQ